MQFALSAGAAETPVAVPNAIVPATSGSAAKNLILLRTPYPMSM
jgi:hypothetical protein